MDRDYLIFYILGIVFLIALVILINVYPANYILVILVGLTIHLTSQIHFAKDEQSNIGDENE